MRTIALLMVGLCGVLLPAGAWADTANSIINEFGTVTITDGGIVSMGSELISWQGFTGPPGHALGSVSFSTGAFTSGGIWTGGTLAAAGSTFDVLGVGAWAKVLTGASKNPVTLFAGSFVGPIHWTLVSHTGTYKYVFTLTGEVAGMLYNGRDVVVPTKQTIYVYQNQWGRDHQGGIHSGVTSLSINTPEPGTLGLFGVGLIGLAGAVRHKFFGA